MISVLAAVVACGLSGARVNNVRRQGERASRRGEHVDGGMSRTAAGEPRHEHVWSMYKDVIHAWPFEELDTNTDHLISKDEVEDFLLDATEELRRKIHRHGSYHHEEHPKHMNKIVVKAVQVWEDFLNAQEVKISETVPTEMDIRIYLKFIKSDEFHQFTEHVLARFQEIKKFEMKIERELLEAEEAAELGFKNAEKARKKKEGEDAYAKAKAAQLAHNKEL